MKRLYANLLGNWTELTSDDIFLPHGSSPSLWIEESMFYQYEDYHESVRGYDFVSLVHNEVEYRIHISQFQIIITKN